MTGGFVKPNRKSARSLTVWALGECIQAVARHRFPGRKRGEIVAAYVVGKDNTEIPEKALIRHCREHLADFKVPREIHGIDKLPLLSNGTVDKVSLRRK